MVFSPFSIAITSLGEERANLVLFVRLFDLCLLDLSVSSSSWCLGRAAVYDCGTPCTFLLPFSAMSPLHQHSLAINSHETATRDNVYRSRII